VAGGGSFIDNEVMDGLVAARSTPAILSIEALTCREQEVLAALATGQSNSAIANELSVSAHAVEKHTTAIFAKLGLTEDRGLNRRVKAVLLYLAGRPDPAVGGSGCRPRPGR
jgi:DNA-binding NarL/FixJ family response regulator